jgi:hypothetical protein
MSGLVSTGAVFATLQATLSDVITDDTDGVEGKVAFTKYLDVGTMKGAFADDAEFAGPQLVHEKPEGQPMDHSTIKQGALTRYMARVFAQEIDFTREVVDDCKYSQVLNAARLQKRAIWITADIDAALLLIRATTAGYVGGDGIVLASASHTLPHGGTFSNIMSTAMSPSRMAVNIAISALKKQTGHDGNISPLKAKKVLCPTEQWATWHEILLSPKAPEAGQFNAVNTVASYFNGVEDIVEIPYWNTTTTNWALKTDAENGLKWLWHTRPETNTWKDNSGVILCHSIYGRWSRGWTDPRGIYFVNA